MPRITGRVKYKRGKRRVAAKQPSPHDALQRLARSNVHGVLFRGAVWVACTRQLAYFLERVCLGRKVPREAAEGVPVYFNRLGGHPDRVDGGGGGEEDSAREDAAVVRLSPEEAFYMAASLECLTVHEVRERGGGGRDDGPFDAQRDFRGALSSPADGEFGGGERGDDLWATVAHEVGENNDEEPGSEEGVECGGGGMVKEGGVGDSGASMSSSSFLVRLTLEELWRAFLSLGCSEGVSRFIWRCAAMVHFRAAGWLPRSGLQYGADFVLYRNHPSLVHSDHCVVLQPSSDVLRAAARAGAKVQSGSSGIHESVDTSCGGGGDAASEEMDGGATRVGLARWTEVQAVSRLCVQVNKGLIAARVHCRAGLDASEPGWLRCVTVHETQIVRFNAERNRSDN